METQERLNTMQSKLTDNEKKILAELDAPIPRDVISKRDAPGGKKLSYLEGWFVIDRMNKIFGPQNWSYKVRRGYPKLIGQVEVEGKSYGGKPPKKGTKVAYQAIIQLTVHFPDQSLFNLKVIEEIGYGDSVNYSDPLAAHELALKESVTDAIKRGAKSLGMSLGLALYDKTQEHVSDAPAPKAVSAAKASSNRKETNTKITRTANTAVKKGALSKEDLVKHLASQYKVETKEALSDTQAEEFLTFLQSKLV